MRCDHCLLDFPDRDAVHREIGSSKKVFCCNGCHGIYRLIHEEGLDKFYEKRQWNDRGISSSFFNTPIDILPFTDHIRDVNDEKEIDVYIDGIRCASCVWLIERVLSRTEGVDYIRVNYATHKARIRWRPQALGLETILKRIQSIGYTPKPYSESYAFKTQRSETRDLLMRFGTAAFLSSQLMIYSIALYAGYFQGIDSQSKLIFEAIAFFLTAPIIFYSGAPLIRSTLIGLRSMRFNMDSLIILGSGSAFFYSIYEVFVGGEVYFDTAAMIITLILLGRYIESAAKGKASESIERLRELSPKSARLVLNRNQPGLEEKLNVPIVSVKMGDLLEVIPGERIPLDGRVVDGRSEADESLITGEARPVSKDVGSEVIGGSVNLHGSFIFEVTKTGKDTVLYGIITAVENAQAHKPKIQTLADRVVGVFVPFILIVSLSTVCYHLIGGWSLHKALMTGISVLVIACPCSLGLATPLAVLLCTTAASSKGILLRSGEVIENMSRVRHILFDKTGTITRGKPSLREVVVIDSSYDRDYITALAAALEGRSEHSLAHAVMEAVRVPSSSLNAIRVSDFRAIPGRGVEGKADDKQIFIGNRGLMIEHGMALPSDYSVEQEIERFEEAGGTTIFMGWAGEVRALIVVADVLRDEVREVVGTLKGMGYTLSLISGDNSKTTRSIASAAGIDQAISETSPTKKREVIAQLQVDGAAVMMVGDGINDAPALTEALVGVAMGRGTDIAMESADAVLVRNDLRTIPACVKLATTGFAIIRQNIFWAFFYNMTAIPLAVAGLLHPIVAAGAMATSSLFVVGNSLRIRNIRGG
ncbi:MAG: heavy metal translocating P-type ATPase [Dissulfurispiraceae bacterium]